MKFTGERYEGGLKGRIAYEHLHRFAACRQLVRGKVVLDIASGSGVGSAILAQTAKRVIGIDIHAPSIEESSQRYSSIANLSFATGNCTAIPLPSASVDIVISLETVEHVADQEQFLDEVHRVLTRDGVLVISTPHPAIYSEAANFQNVFHVKELSLDEFRALLTPHFSRIAVYDQRLAIASFLVKQDSTAAAYVGFTTHPDTTVADGTVTMPEPLYFIAICGNADPLPKIAESLFFDPDDDMLKQLEASHQGELDDIGAELADLRRSGLMESHRRFLQMVASESEAQARALDVFKQARRAVRAAQSSAVSAAGRTAAPNGAPDVSIASSALFDSEWYRAVNAAALAGEIDPIEHYSTTGWKENRNPHPLFDVKRYLSLNTDVAAAGIEPLSHYLAFGWREARSPHSMFDITWYLRSYPEVAAAGVDPLLDYLTEGWRCGRNPHPLFDVSWYLQAYPDVRSAGIEPLSHFVSEAGRYRDPNPLFSSTWYLEQDPAIEKSGHTALSHYLQHGRAEGRPTHLLFDRNWYLSKHSDVARSGLDPLEHFLTVAMAEGRDPHPLFASSWVLARDAESQRAGQHPIYRFLLSKQQPDPHPFFDSEFYRRINPDVVEGGYNVLAHYVESGEAEGRDAHPLFRNSWYSLVYGEVQISELPPLRHFLEKGIAAGRRSHPRFDAPWIYDPPLRLVKAGRNPFPSLVVLGIDLSIDDAAIAAAAQSQADVASRSPTVRDIRARLGVPAIAELEIGLLTVATYGHNHPATATFAPLLQDVIKRIVARTELLEESDPIDVSVIVDVQRSAPIHLLVALASVLASSTRFRFEVLLAGRELTDPIIRQLSRHFPLRTFQDAPTPGPAGCLVDVAALARGRFVLLIGNHYVLPDTLDQLAELGSGLGAVAFVTATLLDVMSSRIAGESQSAPPLLVAREIFADLVERDDRPGVTEDGVDLIRKARQQGLREWLAPEALALALPKLNIEIF